MLSTDVADTLRWIEEQHRSARAEAERLIGVHQARPHSSTAEGVKESMLLAADVAAATGRLEAWNEIHAELMASIRSAGPSR